MQETDRAVQGHCLSECGVGVSVNELYRKEREKVPAIKISTEEKENRETIAKLETYMVMTGIKKPELAKKTLIPYSTLTKRFNEPDTFTRGELRRVCKALRIPREDRGTLV